jgi:transposase
VEELSVIEERAPQALNILDRFYITQHLGKALDRIRLDEIRRLKAEGYDESILRDTKYCALKKTENLTEKQTLKLGEVVLQYKLKTIRGYLLKK